MTEEANEEEFCGCMGVQTASAIYMTISGSERTAQELEQHTLRNSIMQHRTSIWPIQEATKEERGIRPYFQCRLEQVRRNPRKTGDERELAIYHYTKNDVENGAETL